MKEEIERLEKQFDKMRDALLSIAELTTEKNIMKIAKEALKREN